MKILRKDVFNKYFIFFVLQLFSKPTHTRMQNREKQSNSLRMKRFKKKNKAVSQQVWHDKDPSLRKGPARAPSTGLNFVAW
jgi:hypothetical protein